MLECVDLYSGAGGLSLGLSNAGVTIRVAIDADEHCRETYIRNFGEGKFIRSRVQEVDHRAILDRIRNRRRVVVAGGPPCQLFSRLNRGAASDSSEVAAYISCVRSIKPMFVVFENVPAIVKKKAAWTRVVGGLESLGYKVSYGVIKSVEYCIPQLRERLIVVAGKRKVLLPHAPAGRVATVRDAIGHYPYSSEAIPNHSYMNLSPANLRRIKRLEEGGSVRRRGTSFCDSYSRMWWDRPAPTMTTKCISFSNGRFGHPEYNRALTVREAATIQGFPESFTFVGDLWSCARQVGNAVPPPIGEALGRQLLDAAG